jgi:glycosyltransferase involved in cell wall biosynthesis
MKRLGFIARCDLGGLGIESRAFVKHLKPEKVMVVLVGNFEQHPQDFPKATFVHGSPTDADLRAFLADVDVLFAIETPYNMKAFEIAREMGVKTVLRMNYEWFNARTLRPDVLINPVDWHTPPGAIVLPFPIDTEHFEFRLRQKAHTFVHIAGHQAGFDRNGTDLLFQAIPLMKTKPRIIIYSQLPLAYRSNWLEHHPNVEIREGDLADNRDFYADADVLILPRRYAGQSLPMLEALACGVVPVMTDMAPQNAILPREQLIETKRTLSVHIINDVEYADVDPQKVADKMDELYDQPIWQISQKSRRTANTLSWTALLPRYQEILRR